MRHIYISPHLDDAVLSAGGLIYEQSRAGHSVENWTLMCGFPLVGELSPQAQVLHYQWGTTSTEETIHLRRAEDLLVAGILGAHSLHFDFLDCIYRRGKNGHWLYSDVFLPPHEAEADYPAQIAEAISLQLRQDDVLVCPLGIGSHVDHLLVRKALEALRRPLLYYADVPYLFKQPGQLTALTAEMRAQVYPVSEAGLRPWLEAVGAYRSQLGSLFESAEQMRETIRSYWEESGGIRLWRVD